MDKKRLKKIFLYSASILLLLVGVLAVHIYIVTRPNPIGKGAVAMARIDIKDDINSTDATDMTGWLYQQQGVDHVLCNPESNIVVFTYFPSRANADRISGAFIAAFHLNAKRYIPGKNELKGGCPVAATSFSYKAYQFIKHIF